MVLVNISIRICCRISGFPFNFPEKFPGALRTPVFPLTFQDFPLTFLKSSAFGGFEWLAPGLAGSWPGRRPLGWLAGGRAGGPAGRARKPTFFCLRGPVEMEKREIRWTTRRAFGGPSGHFSADP